MTHYARISVNIAQVSGVFDYSIPEELIPAIQPGSLVQVPFGKQVVQGIVVALPETPMVADTREVDEVIESEPVVTQHQIALAKELARVNFSTLSAFLDLMTPPGLSQHADVRVAELRDRACLALEAGAHFGRRGQARRQYLDGHVAPQAGVVGAIHLTHPALADLLDEPVVREHLADHAALLSRAGPRASLRRPRPGEVTPPWLCYSVLD